MKTTIYFDMDGVIVKYDYGLYLPKHKDETPPFLQLGRHVFLNLEAEKSALNAFNHLYHKYHDSDTVGIKTLTNIPMGLLQAEHTLDKFAWCRNNIKGFEQKDFFCTSVKKHDAIADTLWNLTKHDILIDDYQKNLDNWRKHGGRAVKFVNGINSVNPDYDYIKAEWSSERIINKIEKMLRED